MNKKLKPPRLAKFLLERCLWEEEVHEKLGDFDKAITLLYLEKLSYKEIADITGITEKNVGVRILRIKEKLRKMFNLTNGEE
jgi:RNA polymerase sigma-70 factor (ECF subfamily)